MTELIMIRRQATDIPFGFKLQGGTDFAIPLSILSVAPGSLAEQAGLRAGDAILKINEMDTDFMEHARAKTEVLRCGNDFTLTIQRNAVDALKHQPTPLTQLKPTLSMNANANDKLNRAAQFNAMAPPLAKADFTVDKGETINIGSSHNRAPMPFNAGVGSTNDYKAAKPPNWQPVDYTKFMDQPQQPQKSQQSPTVTAVFHNPYNTPIGIYSDSNVFQEFQKQTRSILPPENNASSHYQQPHQKPHQQQPPQQQLNYHQPQFSVASNTVSGFSNSVAPRTPNQPHTNQTRGLNSLSMRMLGQGIQTAEASHSQPPSVFDLKRGENPTGATVPRGFKSVQAPQLLPPEQRHAPVRKEFEVHHVKQNWIEPKFN